MGVEGIRVGGAVGRDGAAVGILLGPVGKIDGTADGTTVGDADGIAVGSKVQDMTRPALPVQVP